MGVVRERKALCESAKNVPSNPESTVQSGYTTQESEDEAGSQLASPVRRPRVRTRLIDDGSLNLAFNRLITRHTGHRRARRILNTRLLEALNEDAEVDLEIENKSKFQLLMEETEDALELLEAYEREQAENVLNGNHVRHDRNDYETNPYMKIPRKIRIAIDGRKNFQYELLKSIEMELTSQLCEGGGDLTFVYTPQTCYERLLVHAVAKFKGLHSETVSEGEGKLVRVSRESDCSTIEQVAVDILLCDYIAYLRAED